MPEPDAAEWTSEPVGYAQLAMRECPGCGSTLDIAALELRRRSRNATSIACPQRRAPRQMKDQRGRERLIKASAIATVTPMINIK
jgi:hypothetical protein